MQTIKIHPGDNVAVALCPLSKGETLSIAQHTLHLLDDIPQGHKIALFDISCGDAITKYGYPIGFATEKIAAGQWVHTHNVKTGLSPDASYRYQPNFSPLPKHAPRTFMGYRRDDGRAAIRNEIWIIPTVGCVNAVAQQLVSENQHLVTGTVDGLFTFPHPYGCSQMSDDHRQTRKLLCALAKHPNAGGVLILGLGCENLTMKQVQRELGQWDDNRIKFLVCQEHEDELQEGAKLLAQLAQFTGKASRQEIPANELVIGMKCGGSDGLSGITANPTVGRFSDALIAQGGSTILTEVPEMFGAENILFERCENEEIFTRAVSMVNDFKDYFTAHGQTVYENPSPGNKEGGITTLEDKSCGCVQKGGLAPVVDVLSYGDAVTKKGLNLLSGPGNDLVSATVLTAAGAHLILFTTGRGTPFGAPAPTIKISTNTPLFDKKRNWIDFNAGTVAQGEDLDDAGTRLFDFVLDIASGERTKSEQHGAREIAIFKNGVTL